MWSLVDAALPKTAFNNNEIARMNYLIERMTRESSSAIKIRTF
jgi:hypothetical protein